MSELATKRGVWLSPVARGRSASARRGMWAKAVAWALLLANGCVIVALWWRGGNVSAANSAGEWLNSFGRLTGLLSAYLALVQLLLLARLPPLERAIGFDRLTVWHRLNGKIVVSLVMGHVVLTTVGYALIDRLTVPAEVNALLSDYPGMVAAAVGTGFFVLVLVSSVVIVRRRLRYEAWYYVHLFAYTAIALAWFHQLPTGNEFLTNAAASNFWTCLYLVTLAALVVFRLVIPVRRAIRYQLRVAYIADEVEGVVSIYLTGRNLDRLGAKAGQFFLWRFLTRDRFLESHPFSLSAAPDGRRLRITVKNVGDFTSRIGQVRPGTRVMAEGPFGVCTADARRRDRTVLIAGGIGITPIRALAEEMGGDVILLYRVVSDRDIVFHQELDYLARIRGVRVVYVAGDHRDPANRHLLTASHLASIVPDIADRDVYVCGPPAMMDVLETSVRSAGVPGGQIHVERFAL